MKDYFTVSEVARQIYRSERWLRAAENNGKIPKAKRDLNGWRIFTFNDIERIKSLITGGEKVNW